MKKPVQLKVTIALLLLLSLGLKIFFQGNTASPEKTAQLDQLRQRLDPMGYQTVLLGYDENNPQILSAKAECLLKISIVQPDGFNSTNSNPINSQSEKTLYVFKGRYFEKSAPRYWPIFSQSLYKLAHSMRVQAVYYPLYKITTATGCNPVHDLMSATS